MNLFPLYQRKIKWKTIRVDEMLKTINNITSSTNDMYKKIKHHINKIYKNLDKTPEIPQEIYENLEWLKKNTKSNTNINDFEHKFSDFENKFSNFIDNQDNVMKPLITNELRAIADILPNIITQDKLKTQLEEYKNIFNVQLETISQTSNDQLEMIRQDRDIIKTQFNSMIKIINIIKNKLAIPDTPDKIYDDINNIKSLIDNKSNTEDIMNKFSEFVDKIENDIKNKISEEIKQFNDIIPRLVTIDMMEEYKTVIDNKIIEFINTTDIKLNEYQNMTNNRLDVYNQKIDTIVISIDNMYKKLLKLVDTIKKKLGNENVSPNIIDMIKTLEEKSKC